MRPGHELKWLFLDLNSYFASVEQQENPSLRGRPVAVVPMKTDSTCAIAASYEAKAYGIKTGTKIYHAKKLCPQLQCVPARHDKYVDYHHRILDEVIKHIPINKVWSVDELSSCLPKRLRCKESLKEAVMNLKEGIRQNVGIAINCSIGIAPNSFLAKVASDMEKPDGLVFLEPDKLPGRLFDLKLTDLPGINVRMEDRLRRAGITTIEQFWNISPKHARKVWGGVVGERFWYNLHGYEVPSLDTKTSVIGHSRILEPTLRHPEKSRLVARRLTIKAASRLRRKNLFATNFSMSVHIIEPSASFHQKQMTRRWASETKLSPAQDNFTFLKTLENMWQSLIWDSKPFKIKKVSVTISGLCNREEITPDLFDLQSKAHQSLQNKNQKLSETIDTLNQKDGSETIQLGPSPKTKTGYVGTKIAFSRIPDKEEFLE